VAISAPSEIFTSYKAMNVMRSVFTTHLRDAENDDYNSSDSDNDSNSDKSKPT
jgi:hypothetical protein